MDPLHQHMCQQSQVSSSFEETHASQSSVYVICHLAGPLTYALFLLAARHHVNT
jgi:hypothetical protein